MAPLDTVVTVSEMHHGCYFCVRIRQSLTLLPWENILSLQNDVKLPRVSAPTCADAKGLTT